VRLLPGYRFLGYIQNHDQIGNRAAGERISHIVNLRRAKIAAGLTLTAPFILMLFQGEEWAASSPFHYFTQHEDAGLGQLISEGRLSEFVAFGWTSDAVPDPQDPATFHRSKLDWQLRQEPHAEMLDWYRQLIELRRSVPELQDANLERIRTRYGEDHPWLVVERGPVHLMCNFSQKTQVLAAAKPGRTLLSSTGDCQLQQDGVVLGPETFAVIQAARDQSPSDDMALGRTSERNAPAMLCR
jgi:maltooligosyltrehalose trehalohydrolase